MHTLLKNHAEVREEIQEQFAHVLVDETQDLSLVQYDIARSVAPNFTMVGDDDQVCCARCRSMLVWV